MLVIPLFHWLRQAEVSWQHIPATQCRVSEVCGTRGSCASHSPIVTRMCTSSHNSFNITLFVLLAVRSAAVGGWGIRADGRVGLLLQGLSAWSVMVVPLLRRRSSSLCGCWGLFPDLGLFVPPVHSLLGALLILPS